MPDSSDNVASGVTRTIDLDFVEQVLRELSTFAQQHDLDVEDVAGEFYYRCCVEGLDKDVASARSIKRLTIPETLDAFDRPAAGSI